MHIYFRKKWVHLKSNGISFSYGYHFPLQKSGLDRLSLGASIRLMHLTFDQDHLIVGETGDQLLGNVDGNRLVPPALSIGFHYQTGVAQYGTPVQFVFAGSISKIASFSGSDLIRFLLIETFSGMAWQV